MTTVIKLGGNDGGEQRVTETVSEVTADLNVARAQHHRFVAFTDAESGKEISVNPAKVIDVFEE